MSLKSFAPMSGLLGGSLIGLSAATLLLFNGDILGASGLISSFVITPAKVLTDPSQKWKIAFLASFFLTTRIYLTMVDADALKDGGAGYSSDFLPIVSPLGFAVGGFLVGFGTKRGNGCTSGHGICGLARLSTRSLAAVLAFMTSGMVASTYCSMNQSFRILDMQSLTENTPTDATSTFGAVMTAIAAGATVQYLFRKTPNNVNASEQEMHSNNKRKIIPAIISAKFFALGLIISKMTLATKVLGFLNIKGIFDGTWDPTLACVMGGGLIVSFTSYQWVKGHNFFRNNNALVCPLGQKETLGQFNVPTNTIIDRKLILGEAIFGLGWGIAGLCPGPALVLGCAGYPNVLFRWWPAFFVGSYLADRTI